MKFMLFLFVTILISFVVCQQPDITTTEPTTIEIQCTIPLCNENEELVFDDVNFCGICIPKKSKNVFNDNKFNFLN